MTLSKSYIRHLITIISVGKRGALNLAILGLRQMVVGVVFFPELVRDMQNVIN